MPLIVDLKQALHNAIDKYIQKEGVLLPPQTQVVTDLRQIINTIDSALHLQQEMHSKLRHLPSKTFAFLPFVNDLPKRLRRVLKEPHFSDHQLLLARYDDLYHENTALWRENEHLRQEFAQFKTSGWTDELVKTLESLKQENVQLSQTLIGQSQAHEEQLQLEKTKHTSLEKHMVKLMQDYGALQGTLKKTQQEKKELTDHHLLKAPEIAQLKEENRRLQEALAAHQQAKTTLDAPPKNNPSTSKTRWKFRFN